MQTQMLSEKKQQLSNLVVSGLFFPHSAWLNRALKYGALDESKTRTNRLFNTVQYISATVQYSSPVDLILVKEGRYHSTPRKETKKKTGVTTFLYKKERKRKKKGTR